MVHRRRIAIDPSKHLKPVIGSFELRLSGPDYHECLSARDVARKISNVAEKKL